MSTTATQGVDARGYLAGWLKGLTSMYAADINAIPDDKWTATFGGCTRAPNVLTADAISMLQWCTEALKGNLVSDSEGTMLKALEAEISTKGSAIAKLTEAAGAFTEALTSASDETLNAEVMAPWGMPAPLYTLAQIAVSHIWYHDGQLNYIQCLLGDEKVHWMGG
jgi:hypothetical protein